MLKNTFLHLPGFGLKTEQRLWSSGVHSWDHLLDKDLNSFSPRRREGVYRLIHESELELANFNPSYFASRLPSNQLWRLFPEFRASVAYLDIETTGLDAWNCSITTIALYDGNSIFTYVQGDNLDKFRDQVMNYKVLVTYNGKCFDIPFIESFFGIKLLQVHIDLRYLLKSLGYTGGLKGCERKAGIDRGELDGLDGYSAVLLWEDYKRARNPKFLETLLAYNIQDVVNLEALLVMAYNLKVNDTPFSLSHQLANASRPDSPFKSDMETLKKVVNSGYQNWRF